VPSACTNAAGLGFYSRDRGRYHLDLDTVPGEPAGFFGYLVINRLPHLYALGLPAVDVRDHHEPVENGYTEQSDEADSRRNTERHPTEKQREDASHSGQRNARKDQQRMTK